MFCQVRTKKRMCGQKLEPEIRRGTVLNSIFIRILIFPLINPNRFIYIYL